MQVACKGIDWGSVTIEIEHQGFCSESDWWEE
jgi:hypothetical protein